MAPQGSTRPELLTLRVRRSHLVEDALRQLGQAENSDLRKPLTVKKKVLLDFFIVGGDIQN